MTRHKGSGVSSRWAGIRIGVFYAVLLGVIAAAVWYFPALQGLLTLDSLNTSAGSANGEITRTMTGGVPLQGTTPTGWESIWVTAVSLVAALAIMIPVAWTYILIKRDAGYEESVVHTLLILPVAVAGIVTIVQGSLALAFSLAGIVAAVRFRTTLEDTKDAVYVFLAIGVGLAAGVQALGVALALSVVFNVVNLALWKLNFGNIYADQLHRTGGLGLGTVIAGPGSGRAAVGFGDRSAGQVLAPSSLVEVKRQQERFRQQLHRESSVAKERKQFSALLIYTHNVDRVKADLIAVLTEMTIRFQLAEVVEGEQDSVSAVTYLVRILDGVSEAEFVAAVRESDAGEAIEAAEVRSLRGLAKDG